MRVALVAVALWFALVAPAAADVFDDNPATASRGPGDTWVFARATNGETLERHKVNGSWTDWASIGGNSTSGPAAVGYGDSVLVFVRGTDGAIHQNTYSGGKWTGWNSIGGYTTSAPAATVRRGTEGYVDVAAKGGDNTILLNTYVPGTGWAGWNSRGGNLTSAPAMNSQANGILNIWARGTDGALKQQSWDGSAWSEWADLGGGIIGAPGAVSRAENIVNVYARGGGNAVFIALLDRCRRLERLGAARSGGGRLLPRRRGRQRGVRVGVRAQGRPDGAQGMDGARTAGPAGSTSGP